MVINNCTVSSLAHQTQNHCWNKERTHQKTNTIGNTNSSIILWWWWRSWVCLWRSWWSGWWCGWWRFCWWGGATWSWGGASSNNIDFKLHATSASTMTWNRAYEVNFSCFSQCYLRISISIVLYGVAWTAAFVVTFINFIHLVGVGIFEHWFFNTKKLLTLM